MFQQHAVAPNDAIINDMEQKAFEGFQRVGREFGEVGLLYDGMLRIGTDEKSFAVTLRSQLRENPFIAVADHPLVRGLDVCPLRGVDNAVRPCFQLQQARMLVGCAKSAAIVARPLAGRALGDALFAARLAEADPLRNPVKNGVC